MTIDLATIGTITTICGVIFGFFWWIMQGKLVSKTEFESYKLTVDNEMKVLSNTHSEIKTQIALVDNNIKNMIETQKEFKVSVEKTNDKLFSEIEHLARGQKQLGENILIYLKQANESK